MARIILLLSIIPMGCYSFEYDPNLPTVIITLPQPQAQIQGEVRMVAIAVDAAGEDISNDIVWLENERPVQAGSDVIHSFSLGQHTVVARVSDETGKVGESDVIFEVIE